MGSKNEWRGKLKQFFAEFHAEVSAGQSAEKNTQIDMLEKEFTQSVLDLKNHISEIEYGQHVEGLYDMHATPELHRGAKYCGFSCGITNKSRS